MKKVIFAMLCGALLIGAGSPAMADEMESDLIGVYAGAKFIDSYQTMWPSMLGYNYYHTQNTVGGGVFAGYDFYPQHNVPIRTELEYAIRSNVKFSESVNVGGGNIEAEANWGLQTVLLNAYVDWHNDTNFTPYLGAGIGAAFLSSEYKLTASSGSDKASIKESTTNTVLAGHFGFGAAYAFSDNISADLGYRMLFTGDSETKFYGVPITAYGSAHEVSMGLRFTF